jgi:hypothetical protein
MILIAFNVLPPQLLIGVPQVVKDLHLSANEQPFMCLGKL